MCTAMAIMSKSNEIIFGRNMDFSYDIDPEIYIFPRNYEWNNEFKNYKIYNKYKFIGTGQDIGKVTLADGINEKGLGVGALYFKGFAHFNTFQGENNSRIQISAIELVNYLLGNCTDVEDVINTVYDIDIIGVKDLVTNSVAPLHWIVVDKSGRCITIEITKKGLEIFDNPLRLLANSPNFEWQMTNLRNYINLSPEQSQKENWGNVELTPFGEAAGTFGLPGDYTSPSRFVRTAFLKTHISLPKSNYETVNMCFNVMKSVAIPKGVVITSRGTFDYTQYTTFMNTVTGDYYFNTHDNNQILKASINDSDSSKIVSLGKLNRISEIEHI